ncbi:MAG TPA: AAA family ATPase [Candidatus Sulfotelmatobacter sp.]|nr:AAA family ATPase [Candidatus Sulfotelmatobacter sp.]
MLDQDQIQRFFGNHLAGQNIPARDQISVRCPFHDDKHASLSINMQEGTWKCHAGCGEGGLIDFEMKASACDREQAKANAAKIFGTNLFGSGGQPEAVYRYRDAQGRLVFEKLRYRGKRFVQRRPVGKGYEYNLDGVEKLLYNLPEVLIANEIIVTEGEKDADNVTSAIRALGQPDHHVAATTNFDGAGKWNDEYNPYFLGKRVVILADNDDIGRQHAQRVAAEIHSYAVGVKVVLLPGLTEHGDVSDFLSNHTAQELLEEIGRTPQWFPNEDAPTWRSAFKSYDELDQGKFAFLIEKFLPHGITFFGGLPGTGKTWLALSVAKALVSGDRFLQVFSVPEPVPVIYLIPESGERTFRTRLDAMRLNNSRRFLCRTNSSGPSLSLDSPELLAAVRAVKPVVILDTAIRFSSAENENDAAQNRKLANQMFGLLGAGARAIVAIHHSTKGSGKDGDVTLENSLRGTGDFGAMADAVYSLRCEDPQKLLVAVQCVKARDFEIGPPFRIQGRPFINDIGDFVMIEDFSDEEKLTRALTQNPRGSLRDLQEATGIGKNRVSAIAEGLGWKKIAGVWIQDGKLIQ